MPDKFLPTRTLLQVSFRHIFISRTSFVGIRDGWVPVTTAWRVLRLRMEERPPLLLLLLLLAVVLTAVELSLGGSSPYTTTDKTNKNKYTQTKQYKKAQSKQYKTQ